MAFVPTLPAKDYKLIGAYAELHGLRFGLADVYGRRAQFITSGGVRIYKYLSEIKAELDKMEGGADGKHK